MKTEKLFTVAGTAEQNGITKVRFANDLVSRVKILDKNNCTDIQLFELPTPMSKLDALRWLKEKDLGGDSAYAIDLKLAEKLRDAKKGEFKVNFGKPVVSKKVTEQA